MVHIIHRKALDHKNEVKNNKTKNVLTCTFVEIMHDIHGKISGTGNVKLGSGVPNTLFDHSLSQRATNVFLIFATLENKMITLIY